MIDLVGCQTAVLDTDLTQPFPPVCVRLDSVSLAPLKVPLVGPPVCSHLLDVGGQICRALKVCHVDKRPRGSQGLIGFPVWPQNHRYDSCFESVPPQFLADVVFGLGVLERQVKETVSNGWQQPPLRQVLLVPPAVNLYGNICLQALVEGGPGLGSLVVTDDPAGQTGTIWRRLGTSCVTSRHGHSIRDVYVGVETVAHCPVEDPIQLSQVSEVGRRLHGHPHPVLGGRAFVGQQGQTFHQLLVVEDDHVGRAVSRGVVGEETPADVVQLQTFVPVEAVGAAERPVPQQDAEVPRGNICLVFLRVEGLVERAVVEEGGEAHEEEEEERLGRPRGHHCGVCTQPAGALALNLSRGIAAS